MTAEPTTLRASDRSITADMIAVEVGKGCVLLLTPQEYCDAVARGKRIRRAQRHGQNKLAAAARFVVASQGTGAAPLPSPVPPTANNKHGEIHP